MAGSNQLVEVGPRGIRRADQEFLPAALQILETPQSPVTAAMTLAICALVVAAIAWGYWGHIDIIAIAPGKFQPAGRVKAVQPLETGKVRRIGAVNGAEVKAGDVLLELDGEELLDEERALEGNLIAYRSEAVRRRVALDVASRDDVFAPPIPWDDDVPATYRQREQRVLEADVGQLRSNLDSLQAQVAQKDVAAARLSDTVKAERDLISTLQERVDMRSALVALSAGTKASLLDAAETLKSQQTTLSTQLGQLAEATSGRDILVAEMAKARRVFVSDNSQKLAEDERQVDELSQKLDKARSATRRTIIRSPVDGVIQSSLLTNVGQVVTTGSDVMRVVPRDAPLEVDAYLPNKDIGFVRVGQRAVIKVESFPFTHYGTVSARVTRVATDAIPQTEAQQSQSGPMHAAQEATVGGGQRTQDLVFPITLVADAATISADGEVVPLSPGMSVTVEVLTGRRRILEYLFSPLVEVGSRALKER